MIYAAPLRTLLGAKSPINSERFREVTISFFKLKRQRKVESVLSNRADQLVFSLFNMENEHSPLQLDVIMRR